MESDYTIIYNLFSEIQLRLIISLQINRFNYRVPNFRLEVNVINNKFDLFK